LPIKVNKQYFYCKTVLEHESFLLLRASVLHELRQITINTIYLAIFPPLSVYLWRL
jgi:hypothetical protein